MDGEEEKVLGCGGGGSLAAGACWYHDQLTPFGWKK